MLRTKFRGVVALAACTAAMITMASNSAFAISGGQEVGIDQVPWQVAVRVGNTSACGGAIIDASRVLTAAHCVAGAAPSTVEVTAGTSSFSQPPSSAQKVTAANVRVHPYYRPLPDDHDDIAVIELSRPLALGGADAQAIALAPAGPKLPAGTPLTISGYGHIQSLPARGAGPLRRGATAANGPEQCSVGYENANAVWLCMPSAASFAKTCPGDSGGPVTALPAGAPAPVLVGIVSGGSGPDCTQAFDGSADVTAPEIRAFIDGASAPPVAPKLKVAHEAVGLNDAERAGEMLTCKAPQIDGAPKVTIQFAHQAEDVDRTTVIERQVVQAGSSPRRALRLEDVGKSMVCIVVATNAGGTSTWASDDQSELRLPIEATRSRPVVRIRRASCRRRRCTVSFRIRERRSVAGPSRIDARIGRKRLRVRSLGRGRYRASGRRPRGRRLRVRISAVSAASGRKSRTARRTVRVRRR